MSKNWNFKVKYGIFGSLEILDDLERDLGTGLRLRGSQQVDAGEEPRFQGWIVQP